MLDASAPTRLFPTHDVGHVLDVVGGEGIHHALLEGGPTLAAAFLRSGLVDEVVAYIAPALLGAGPSAVGGLGIDTIRAILRLDPTHVAVLGGDVRITATPHRTDLEVH